MGKYEAYFNDEAVMRYNAPSNEAAISDAKSINKIRKVYAVYSIDENEYMRVIYNTRIEKAIDISYKQSINNSIASLMHISNLSDIEELNRQISNIQNELKNWTTSLRERNAKYY